MYLLPLFSPSFYSCRSIFKDDVANEEGDEDEDRSLTDQDSGNERIRGGT